MSFWALVLITIGVVSIVVSLANARHPPTSTDYIAVHKDMSTDRIAKQLKKGPKRVDATLGIQYGAAFIVLGIAWQFVIYRYWF